MSTSTAAKDAAADAVTALVTHLTTLDEAGVENATARQAVTWDASAGNGGDNTAQIDIAIPSSEDVFWVAGYTANAGGTQHTKTPAGSTFKRPCHIDGDTNTINLAAHGLSNDDRVVLEDHDGGGLPTGLAEETFYYVVGATTDSFQVSTTQGGSAVAITGDGNAYVQDAVPQPFPSGGTYSIAAGAYRVEAVV
ncbi:MAG: hypothetical protein AAFZ07_19580 [Actinomycetota bacterium]